MAYGGAFGACGGTARVVAEGTGARFTTWPDPVGILPERVREHPELAGGDATEYGALHVFHRP